MLLYGKRGTNGVVGDVERLKQAMAEHLQDVTAWKERVVMLEEAVTEIKQNTASHMKISASNSENINMLVDERGRVIAWLHRIAAMAAGALALLIILTTIATGMVPDWLTGLLRTVLDLL